MIRQAVLFPFRVVLAVGCVAVILMAAPVLVLLDERRRRGEDDAS